MVMYTVHSTDAMWVFLVDDVLFTVFIHTIYNSAQIPVSRHLKNGQHFLKQWREKQILMETTVVIN